MCSDSRHGDLGAALCASEGGARLEGGGVRENPSDLQVGEKDPPPKVLLSFPTRFVGWRPNPGFILCRPASLHTKWGGPLTGLCSRWMHCVLSLGATTQEIGASNEESSTDEHTDTNVSANAIHVHRDADAGAARDPLLVPRDSRPVLTHAPLCVADAAQMDAASGGASGAILHRSD